MDLLKCDILLVEDDPAIVLLLNRAFERASLEGPLCRVADGDEAVRYFQGEGDYADRLRYPIPALVLLDLHLPKRSGLEVLAWIRSEPEFCGIPVVILTGEASDVDVKRAYELGANSVLFAPIEQAALVEQVKAIRDYWLLYNRVPRGKH